jgi:hypothetical protein
MGLEAIMPNKHTPFPADDPPSDGDQEQAVAPTRAPASSGGRKRGAQSGNSNAFQHGFYARSLPPIEWNPSPSPAIDSQKSYAADTLEYEIQALRVLISRLAAVQDEPDPEMKDPDAPFNTLLSASHRLDTLLRLQNALQAYVSDLENVHYLRDFLVELNKESTPLSELLTVNNIEKIRLQLGGPETIPFKQFLSADDLQKYASIFCDPEPDQEDIPFYDDFDPLAFKALERKINESRRTDK